ncbi:hypothetical protein [[Mycoplasma] testudinis]|uniref:hypothetical protein n=1 Tax=[Mycoplasma] testudinis TaxID=33924 RepID=UPI0004861FE4|nr:hypothetical protein [[Mycoplasma] testudinis]
MIQNQDGSGALNLDTAFASIDFPGWAIAVIIIGCLTLISFAAGIYWYIRKKRDIQPKNLDKLEKEKEIEHKKTGSQRIFGIYNTFGSKTAVTWFSTYYVKNKPGACELCTKWSGKILSYRSSSTEFVKMDEAVAQGYHHLGCRCEDVEYKILETKILKNKASAEELKQQYEKKLEQLKFELEIRQINTEMRNSIHKQEINELIKKRAKVLDKYDFFLKEHKYLERNELAEKPNAAYYEMYR